MELKLSSNAENYLIKIAKNSDNLFDGINLNVKIDGKSGRTNKKTLERLEKLKHQLPVGIYTNPKQIAEIIKAGVQKIAHDPLKYSPFVIDFPDFKCCKLMKYRQGNIITGRDKEINDILLTFTKSGKRGVILTGEPGVGKAQPMTSPILIKKNRWSLNCKLKVGDKVITRSGKEATVLGIFPQGKQDTYRITFKDGRSTLCTKEHLWKVYSKNWKKLGSESRVIELDLIKQIKDNTREKLYVDLYIPENIDDKSYFIDPYILGVLIGNGCLTKEPEFTSNSDKLISFIEQRLVPTYTLRKTKSRSTFQCRINSSTNTNQYLEELRRLRLDNQHSYEKFIPEEYKEGSIQQRENLIAGLLDTDGSVGANGSVLYYTTSKILADDICYIIRSLGGIAKVTNKTTHYKYNNKTKTERNCYVVSIRYKNSKNLFKLTRKRDRLPEKYQYEDLKLEIVSVEKEGVCDCQCIYIDDPDHLYVTDDFIVTHNTAIVRALNNRLIERNVPRQLNGSYILNLDVPYVFSKFKEDPIGVIIKTLEKASEYDKAILFIDEVHQLLSHRMNDIMKPYLTEKIRFIGSTTVDEYHSIITDDRALERRFTIIPVDEPNISKTTSMVINTKSTFENYHKCIIPDEMCSYAVINGSRFLGHRRNPDKSLDLIDIACSIMYEKEIKFKNKVTKNAEFSLANLENKRKEILESKETVGDRILNEDYVNLAISSITGISFGEIKNSLNYTQVVNNINNIIFGQDDQIKTLSNVVNIFKHVKADRDRPVSVLLVVGPTGVGKTSTCRALAKNLYGKDSCFLDFDMSGMTSEFMLTELKGAPPGYIGYGKSGKLIKQIRQSPQSVIYFRGINRSHEIIKQYIVDACRKGTILDSAEREASLNNAVIIYSVTVTDKEYEKLFKSSSKTMGFSKIDESNNESKMNKISLEEIIGKDLVNASDEIVIFNKLEEKTLSKIFDKNVDEYLEMYNIGVDRKSLKKTVLDNSKNGKDVISKLSSEVPKLVFKKLKTQER